MDLPSFQLAACLLVGRQGAVVRLLAVLEVGLLVHPREPLAGEVLGFLRVDAARSRASTRCRCTWRRAAACRRTSWRRRPRCRSPPGTWCGDVLQRGHQAGLHALSRHAEERRRGLRVVGDELLEKLDPLQRVLLRHGGVERLGFVGQFLRRLRRLLSGRRRRLVRRLGIRTVSAARRFARRARQPRARGAPAAPDGIGGRASFTLLKRDASRSIEGTILASLRGPREEARPSSPAPSVATFAPMPVAVIINPVAGAAAIARSPTRACGSQSRRSRGMRVVGRVHVHTRLGSRNGAGAAGRR